MKVKLLFSILILLISSFEAHAVIIPGWLDWNGNPVHSEDEVDVKINTTVTKVVQGYRYTYTLTSMQSSLQNISVFKVFLPDPYTSVVQNTESSPWGPNSRGWYPYTPHARPSQAVPPGFVYPKEYWRISWVAFRDVHEIQPGTTASGFTFVSPFPPGIGEAYLRGYSHPPVQRVGGIPLGEEESMPVEWTQRSKYGTGKVVPTIAPVKPIGAIAGIPVSNATVQQCIGTTCTVQINTTGPQDPTGTTYTYTWSGAFGTAAGANPTLQLPPGTNPLTLTVSDTAGTVLTTATIDVVVVDPNTATTPPAVGNNGNDRHNDEKNDSEDDDHDNDDEENDD